MKLAAHPLVSFFLLAFLGSWTFDTFRFLYGWNGLAGTAPRAFLGPALAAFVMAAVLDGRRGARELLRRCVQWRVRPRWYLVAIFVILVADVIAWIVVPGTIAALRLPEVGIEIAVLLVVVLALGGRSVRSRAGAGSPCLGCSRVVVPCWER